MGGFNFFHGDHEVGCFAGHVLTMVVGRKCQLKSFAFAIFHAAHCFFKFFEHLAFAHQELEVCRFTARENFAVDLAFKVNRHAVAIDSGIGGSTLRKGAALLAQNVNCFVNGFVGDFCAEFFNCCSSQVTQLHFRIDLEDGIKCQLTFGCAIFFRNSGLASNAHFGFIGCKGKGLTHLVVHDFVLNRVTIALSHHIHGHFARTETVHLDGTGHFLQTGVNFRLDDRHRQ